MSEETSEDASRNATTRRGWLRRGSAVVAGSVLAGCLGSGGDGSTDDGPGATDAGTRTGEDPADTPVAGASPTEGASGGKDTATAAPPSTSADGETPATATPSGTANGSGTPTHSPSPTPDDGPYTVRMAPMGEVTFESVPERVYTGLPNTIDMAVAAGHADAVTACYYPEYHGTLLNRFYDRLDGVSFEWEGLTDSWNLGKEAFYELDSDVHLTDPAYASTLKNLDGSDVTEIGNQVGPWFGNYYSNRHADPPEKWADGYEYYSLWEIFERVGQVFRAGDRAKALAAVREDVGKRIETDLPPADERPSVAMAFPGKNNTFWVYHTNTPGFLTAHTRPLGAPDAFGDHTFDGPSKQIDSEALVEADPDVLLVLFTLASSYSITDIRASLRDDPVASQASAVRNDRVYAQGARYQGPLVNLFQLEMTAKQLYPDAFGAWPGYEDGASYPAIPTEEQLFDRDRVATIVNGDY